MDFIPKFIGTDLKTYGPFKKDETDNVPLEIAELLINREKAQEV